MSDAATVIRCGYDDDYQEVSGGPVFVRPDCGGAPVVLQKGFFTLPTDAEKAPVIPTVAPNVVVTTTPETTTPVTPEAGCTADAALGIAVSDVVKLRNDAIVRDAPAGKDTGRRGNDASGTVTKGPECAGGLVWWEVTTSSGPGWTAEQDQSHVPPDSRPLGVDGACEVERFARWLDAELSQQGRSAGAELVSGLRTVAKLHVRGDQHAVRTLVAGVESGACGASTRRRPASCAA